jgi:tight adherence protein B
MEVIMSVKVLTDYSKYAMTHREKAFYTIAAAVVIYTIAYIFYRNLIISAILVPIAFLYPRIKTTDIIKRRKKELNLQFKDMLYSLASSLTAGRSVESAFRDVLRDLAVLYPDPGTFIITEVEHMVRRLEMNETVEHVLMDFAKRACLEDMDNFVDVFAICKRTGGNMVEVIKNTSAIINDRIEVFQEIDTMLAERKFEQKVLNVVPLFMIVLLSVSAEDYMKPVFATAAGKIVMSISIALLAAAYYISKRITDFKL